MVVYGLTCAGARKYGYRLLHHGAKLHWEMKTLPEILRGERGKPYFQQDCQHFFNISHSGDQVVCALDCAPVGVDIQRVRSVRKGLPDRVFAPAERAWLRQRGDRAEDFALLWAMKESRCKCTGQGLTQPIQDISIPLPLEGSQPLEWEGLRYYMAQGQNWRFCLCGTGVWDGAIKWITERDILAIEETI